MQDLEVINMPGYCHLFTVDICVGNAGIIWVDDKGCLVILEVGDNFFVEEEGALEESVYCH